MKRVLIIDDEPNILSMLEKMLKPSGYQIDVAQNGYKGLQVFRDFQPDLVITDIIMPEKEGLETIREMLQIKPDLKIIAMSGGGKVSPENYLDAARIFGASLLIAKPFTKAEMVSAVEELLGE